MLLLAQTAVAGAAKTTELARRSRAAATRRTFTGDPPAAYATFAATVMWGRARVGKTTPMLCR